MTAPCPEIEKLLDLGSAGAPVLEHVRSCEACEAVLQAVRSRPSSKACDRIELVVAKLVSGSIDAGEQRELSLHLAACSACSELVSRMTSARDALAEIPEPRIDRASRDERPDEIASAKTGARQRIRDVAAAEIVVPESASWLARIGPPRSHRAVWVLQLAVAAAAAGLLVHALDGRSKSATNPSEAGEPASQAGSGADDARLHDAEQRITSAEERMRWLEDALAARDKPNDVSATPSPGAKGSAPQSAPPIAIPTPVPSFVIDPLSGARRPVLPRIVVPTVLPPVPPPPPAIQSGSLSVNCNPFCDSVSVDGKNVGPSPIVQISLGIGAHQIQLKKAGFAPQIRAVQIKPGEVVRLTIDMRRDTPKVDIF